ncbi:hypothetical protein LC087_14115 [Bacillus carboniphilus]|uniref:Stage II sporulation protein E N-terminal domain-containing protein n=1 Tax=Bacillus carboniphilus TaxID=86663 RepID=A0ABY9JTW1_9BACI|nr:hypothetical protein [Bacillus carboniphilus]WLR41938.1 hypothetical protein LC087_14115 [Bacillus carboniphilus]
MERVNRTLWVYGAVMVGMNHLQVRVMTFLKVLKARLYSIFFFKGLIFSVIGFLLGRALILTELSPFSLSFFATTFLMKRERALLVAFSLIAGALTVEPELSIVLIASMLLFLFFFKLLAFIYDDSYKTLPVMVGLSLFLSRISFTWTMQQELVPYDYFLATVEAGLGLILTLIFLQCIPLITTQNNRYTYKVEEIICFMILLASILTGLIGLNINGVQAEFVAWRSM